LRRRAVIERWECRLLRGLSRAGRWVLVYGRRKTGKTWLLRRCWDWSLYATVTGDGFCVLEERGRGPRLVAAGDCVEAVARLIRSPGGGGAVVDEFQRLPRRLWELLAATSPEAEAGLALCGSSLGVARRVFSRGSPLLGLLAPLRVDLASYPDTVASLLRWGLGPRDALLWAVAARDPWLLRHIEPRGEPWRVLAAWAHALVPAARGLVGEVFEEEERSLTRLYDAVLRLLSEGYWRAADLAARLAEAGLTSAPHPGSVTGVLRVLEDMGLVERVPLWRTRGARVYYRHRSSLLRLLLAVAATVEELGAEPRPETIHSMYGVELQFNLGEMLAEAKGLRRGYSIQPGGRDIDVVLLDDRGRAHWGYEVKAGPLPPGEAREAVERIRAAGIPRAGLAALQGIPDPDAADEALDAESLASLAARLSEERAREAERAAAQTG